MTSIYLLAIAVVIYMATISMIVVGQEISIILAILLFFALAYTSLKLATKYLTKM
ncbi:MAG: hypothetical protein JNJ85_12505 [Candidatus Kapabacteria bacterium]|nr:hypothetical protein [Candidatus Kapabacteria bacterium]MBX7156702.1 hypothetical protein [Bacteroidota bacterium]